MFEFLTDWISSWSNNYGQSAENQAVNDWQNGYTNETWQPSADTNNSWDNPFD